MRLAFLCLLMMLPLRLASASTGAVDTITLPGVQPGERLVVHIQQPPGRPVGRPARELWLLDGDTSLTVATEAVRLVALECDAEPPVIITVGDGHAIGTPGNQRHRDYTPVPSAQPWAQGGGGAAAWLEALQSRVLPTVQARLGPARERTLYGHSYGGLAVAFAWWHAPALFDRWVLASPALYYGDDWALRMVEGAPTTERAVGGRQLLLAGSEEGWAVEGNARWRDALAAWPASTRPAVESLTLAGFGHLTGSPVSVMRAVRWAYCPP